MDGNLLRQQLSSFTAMHYEVYMISSEGDCVLSYPSAHLNLLSMPCFHGAPFLLSVCSVNTMVTRTVADRTLWNLSQERWSGSGDQASKYPELKGPAWQLGSR